MPPPSRSTVTEETREQRMEAVRKQVRLAVEATVRELVERAVDVSEAEAFGAIDLEFRDAGLDMANERSGKPAWRVKKGYIGAA